MEPPAPRLRTLHLVLIAVIVASLPCYCAGLIAIRRAPGEPTPTAAVSPTPSATAPLVAPSATLIPGPTLTPSITPTAAGLHPLDQYADWNPVPDQHVDSHFHRHAGPHLTPTPTDTPVPTDTPTPETTG